MPLIRFFKRRPLIGLTLLYILLLLVLDRTGFFLIQPVFLPDRGQHRVEGLVIDVPQNKPERIVFPVDTLSIDGREWKERVQVTLYGETPVSIGDTVSIAGTLRMPDGLRNEGGFDYRNYLQRQGVHLVMYARAVERTGHRPVSLLRSAALSIRDDIIGVIKNSLPEREASVLIPMLVGDKSGLTRELSRSFADAGVMHVLVVSGMNVAYSTAIFLVLFRLLGLRPRQAALCTIPFILLYVFVTGATPPVVRAGVMALFVILSLSLAREPLIYQSLSLAALCILIADPQALFTASFQLSFAATIGIVALYPFLMLPFTRLPSWARNTIGATIAVSLAAQLSVIPLIIHYFNRVSLIGIISNIFVVPLTALVTITGIALYIFHFISAPLTAIAAACSYYLVRCMLYLIAVFATVPWATVDVAAPSLTVIAAYYLLLFSLPVVRKDLKTAAVLAASTIVLVMISAGMSFYHRDGLRVTFLDVGNGDSVHVSFPGDVHWLIDGGGTYGSRYDPGEKIINPYLVHKGVRYIQRLVITHHHLPHIGGLKAVIERFPVGEVVVSPYASDAPDFAELRDIIRRKNIPLREAQAGERYIINGSTVCILAPRKYYEDEDEDDNCLIVSLESQGRRFLLTSDMGVQEEHDILAAGIPLMTAVLQLPNHGRRKLTEEFLRRCDPKTMVVSTGKMGDMQPEKRNSTFFSTADKGAVTFTVIDGKMIPSCVHDVR